MSAGITVYVVTKDMTRLREFYGGGLDVRPASQQGNWLPFDVGGATFALHAFGGEAEDDLRAYNVSFRVDDIEAAVARFEAAGASVLRGVADETFGRMATLQDPDGRAFELVQHE